LNGIIVLFIQILFFRCRLRLHLETANEVHKIAGWSYCIVIDDHHISLANDFVSRPASVGTGVLTASDNDFVYDFASFSIHEIDYFSRQFPLGDSRFGPFIAGLIHRKWPIGEITEVY
jgi:hypothetical protein